MIVIGVFPVLLRVSRGNIESYVWREFLLNTVYFVFDPDSRALTFAHMNVLLLEDEPELSAVACEQIESRGHQVFPALDIAHARAILEDESLNIDILIADQKVPDGNGSLFAIETKAMPRNIKVVVVSGQLSGSDVEQLKDNGVNYYNKPSLYSDIVEEMVQKHFSNSSETSS